MRRFLLVPLAALAGCQAHAGPNTVKNAEALIRKQVDNPAIGFHEVQFTGDSKSGQTCGYFTRPNEIGGTDAVRFIVFVDGNQGQNPYIDDPAAPFPLDKSDFESAWQGQCVKLGFKDADDSAHAEPVDTTPPKKKGKKKSIL